MAMLNNQRVVEQYWNSVIVNIVYMIVFYGLVRIA